MNKHCAYSVTGTGLSARRIDLHLIVQTSPRSYMLRGMRAYYSHRALSMDMSLSPVARAMMWDVCH